MELLHITTITTITTHYSPGQLGDVEAAPIRILTRTLPGSGGEQDLHDGKAARCLLQLGQVLHLQHRGRGRGLA